MSLRKTVEEFRAGILDGHDPESWCWMVSAPLAGFLEATGIQCEMVEGRVGEAHHFWLALHDGTIIDATASQFLRPNGRKMPKVYIGPLPAWYAPVPVALAQFRL